IGWLGVPTTALHCCPAGQTPPSAVGSQPSKQTPAVPEGADRQIAPGTQSGPASRVKLESQVPPMAALPACKQTLLEKASGTQVPSFEPSALQAAQTVSQ